jgi:nicotinate-nucleotide adenylyltransferase
MAQYRVGIYGGTFDPPHIGHEAVARAAMDALRLDRLLIIPSADPPHKRATTNATTRLKLTHAAFGAIPGVEVSAMELEREGPSYTVTTLREIAGQNPDAELYLIIGSDQAAVLDTWRGVQEIAGLATICVAARPGYASGESPVPLLGFPCERIDLSSTRIRAMLERGEAVEGLVSEGVARLLRRAAA